VSHHVELTSEALRYGSHSLYHANTPYLPACGIYLHKGKGTYQYNDLPLSLGRVSDPLDVLNIIDVHFIG